MMKAAKLSTLATILALTFTIANTGAAAETAAGFDTDEYARFQSVTVPVGNVQDSSSLGGGHSHSLSHRHGKRKNYFDEIMAIGLTNSEMKNLDVQSGQMLEVVAGSKHVVASVYKVEGPLAPPTGTINLSVAAAKKLGAKRGTLVTVQQPGASSLPTIAKKKGAIKFTKK